MGRVRGLLLRIFMMILLLPAAQALGAAVDRPAVTAVRVADHDGVTRFVMELSGDTRFQVLGQGEPSHVVVEFPGISWGVEGKGLTRPVGFLRGYHFEASGAGADRLVLDLRHPAAVRKAFLIPPGESDSYRFVLDLGAAPVPSSRAAAKVPVAPPSPPSPPSPPPVAAPNPFAAVQPVPSQPAPASTAHKGDGEAIARGALPPHAAPTQPASAAVPAPQPVAQPTRTAEHKAAHPGKPVVVIDPGHGGVDPGATSISGAYEKNIVLALAKAVKVQLDKGGKVKCVLTRDRDVFIPLRDRVAIARAANADLFMSLHADTVADPDIRGLSVYTLSQNASDAEAQALADKENKADIVAGLDLSNESPEVTNILIDLVQRESMNLSAVFAHQLIREVSHDTRQLLQNTHRFAGFAVLKAPDVPSVLVETGYLSNVLDEQMLRRPEYRAKLAGAMARAIELYFVQTRKAHH